MSNGLIIVQNIKSKQIDMYINIIQVTSFTSTSRENLEGQKLFGFFVDCHDLAV